MCSGLRSMPQSPSDRPLEEHLAAAHFTADGTLPPTTTRVVGVLGMSHDPLPGHVQAACDLLASHNGTAIGGSSDEGEPATWSDLFLKTSAAVGLLQTGTGV